MLSGVVRQSRGHLPVDQLPVRLPVCDRIRGRELLHHAGGDEEDEGGEGQHRGQRGIITVHQHSASCGLCLTLVAKHGHYMCTGAAAAQKLSNIIFQALTFDSSFKETGSY